MSQIFSFLRNPTVLVICFLLIVAVRFNRNSLVVNRPLNDAQFYIANVQLLRSEPLTYAFKGPFNERILVTTLAAVTPFEPLTAINVVNILCLLAAMYFLYLFLKILKLSESIIWLGMYLFVFSFPTFYYSTIGYTDPGVLFAIFLGAYSIYDNKYFLFLLAMLLGTLAKEGAILLVPIALSYGFSRSDKKWYAFGFAGLLLFLGLSAFVKSKIGNETNETFYWVASWDRAIFNLRRFNFYFSSLMSLGIPMLICLFYLFLKPSSIMKSWKEDLPLITGVLVAFLPWLYMVPSAFPDGRAFWIASCFPIGLAMVWWQRFGAPFGNKMEAPKQSELLS